MKYEWRKKEKNYYLPKTKPDIVNIEKLKFIQIKGKGNPNSDEFSERVGVLYSLAYAIKMMPKNGINPRGYFDYEYKTFEVMKEFCKDNNLLIKNMAHREIYISDFRRTSKEKLKTVLRYMVETE